MINIEVDESYAFDYLSILQIKSELDLQNTVKLDNYINCLKALRNQLDENLFLSIIGSQEYKACHTANLETFKAVDQAKDDSVPASFVDRANYKRHIAKQGLQKKFFNSDLTEIKIGYEKYEGK